jgi:hypothetical protein
MPGAETSLRSQAMEASFVCAFALPTNAARPVAARACTSSAVVGKVGTGVHNTLLKVTTIRIRGDPVSYVPTLGMDDWGVKNPRIARDFFAVAALRYYPPSPSGRGLTGVGMVSH